MRTSSSATGCWPCSALPSASPSTPPAPSRPPPPSPGSAAHEIARLVRDGRSGRLQVGVGVNSGRVVVGTIGGGGRRDFTVIGDPVNTAARVEAATRLTGDDILITETTLHALGRDGDDFEERPSAPLKGKAARVRLYAPRPEPRQPRRERATASGRNTGTIARLQSGARETK